MAKRKETEFDKLARLIKSEGEDIQERLDKTDARTDRLETRMDKIERKIDEGFSAVIRRLDGIIQTQLDQHAHRIKKLETAVFK